MKVSRAGPADGRRWRDGKRRTLAMALVWTTWVGDLTPPQRNLRQEGTRKDPGASLGHSRLGGTARALSVKLSPSPLP